MISGKIEEHMSMVGEGGHKAYDLGHTSAVTGPELGSMHRPTFQNASYIPIAD